MKNREARIARKALLVAAGAAVAVTTQGCIATRGWVESQMQPVTQQVSSYDERLTQAETRINNLSGRLAGVEGTLRVVDTKSEQALNALANLKVERRVVIDLKEGATFGFGSSTLPKKARKEIDAVLGDLKAQPGGLDATTIVVAGHTDNAGSPEYNYDLGQQRAKAVAQYVNSKTASDPLQVIPVSYGESAPLSTNSTPTGRSKNRRVEILVYRDVVTSSVPAAPAAADKEPGDAPPPATPAKLSQNH